MSKDLGPLPEPIVLTESNDGTPHAYTADQLRAERERCYALGVADERERIAAALDAMHRECSGRHNYYACLARELRATGLG